jgi:hypothetical protein
MKFPGAGGLTLRNLASAAATPGSGEVVLYALSNELYMKDSAGVVHILTDFVDTFPLTRPGALTVAAGTARLYLPSAYTLLDYRVSVGTAPTGASLIVDINKNGTTLFTTQSARPTITASSFLASTTAPAITTFAAGDYITVDVDQIGSTVAGSDLVVVLRMTRES